MMAAVGIERIAEDKIDHHDISRMNIHITMIRGMVANSPATSAERIDTSGFKSLLQFPVGIKRLFMNLLYDGMYTRIPRVAENDIQKPASRIAPGEERIIMNAAIESEVRESAASKLRIDKYTAKIIMIARTTDNEKPVMPIYINAINDKIIAIAFLFIPSFFSININAPIMTDRCIPLRARICETPALEKSLAVTSEIKPRFPSKIAEEKFPASPFMLFLSMFVNDVLILAKKIRISFTFSSVSITLFSSWDTYVTKMP